MKKCITFPFSFTAIVIMMTSKQSIHMLVCEAHNLGFGHCRGHALQVFKYSATYSLGVRFFLFVEMAHIIIGALTLPHVSSSCITHWNFTLKCGSYTHPCWGKSWSLPVGFIELWHWFYPTLVNIYIDCHWLETA